MLTKFVVRKVYTNSSVRLRCYNNIKDAINNAICIYKEQNAELLGFDVVVETRYADENRLYQDFAIDQHIRWASYFNMNFKLQN